MRAGMEEKGEVELKPVQGRGVLVASAFIGRSTRGGQGRGDPVVSARKGGVRYGWG